MLYYVLARNISTALSGPIQTKHLDMSLSLSLSLGAKESTQDNGLGAQESFDFAARLDAAFHLGEKSEPTVETIFEAFVAKQNGDKQKCVEPVAHTAVGKEHTTVFDRLELEQIKERTRNGYQNCSDAVYLDPNTKTSLAAICEEVAPAFEWDLFKYRDFCGRLKEWIEAAKDAEYDLVDDSSCGDGDDATAYESSSVYSSTTVDSRS